MSATPAYLVATLLLAAPVYAQQTSGNPVAVGQKEAESIVQQFEAKYLDAYNRRDSKAVAVLFSENGSEFGEFGAVTKGRQEIEKALAISFALPLGWKTEDVPKNIQAITSDVIVEQGMSLRTALTSGPQPPQKDFYTKVLVREGNEWRLAAVQYASPPSRFVGKGAESQQNR